MLEYIENPAVWIIAVLAVCTVCVRLITWINSVNTDRKSFEKSIDKMDKRITEIADRIDIKITQINDRIHDVVLWSRQPSKTVHMDSPLSLTDLGERVAEHLNSSEIVDSLVEDVYEKAKSLPPYDVQNLCFSYARNWTPPDEMALRIKDSAYQHGISWDETVEVIAIQLRDRVLKHQGQDTHGNKEQQLVA